MAHADGIGQRRQFESRHVPQDRFEVRLRRKIAAPHLPCNLLQLTDRTLTHTAQPLHGRLNEFADSLMNPFRKP